MHPWDHARSSAKLHGGLPESYLALHSWFDMTKVAAVKSGHRMFRHHSEGIQEAVRVFGTSLNVGHKDVSTEALGRQHVQEDCAEVPAAKKWLDRYPVGFIHDRLICDVSSDLAEKLALKMAHKFGGKTLDYLPLHTWFLETCSWIEDERHLVFRHNSFGVFEAESRFGVVLTREDGYRVPVRVVAEHHIRTIFKLIPSAAEVIRNLFLQTWMGAATSPRALGLD